MKLIQKTLAFICTAMILAGMLLVPACAEEAGPATPTDLEPTAPGTEGPDGSGDKAAEDEAGEGLEIIITKAVKPGQTWSGKLKRKKPSVLKLDLDYAQAVYILIEGKDVAATLRKADAADGEAPEQTTDPETDRLVIELDAEAGSYLLFLRAGENSLLAKVTVSFMSRAAYEEWEAENRETGREEEPAEETTEEEPEADPEGKTEQETEPGEEAQEPGQPEEAAPETAEEGKEEQESAPAPERSITVHVTWDVPDPVIGDTAHFKATLTGYEGLDYTMQWQYSHDRNDWIDIAGETKDTLDMVVTEENNFVYWRIIVYLEEPEEETEE